MKLKILFLFFFITFFSCKIEDTTIINYDKIEHHNSFDSIYKLSTDKKLSFKKRLSYAKKLIKSSKTLNDSIYYLILNNTSYLQNKLKRLDSAIKYSKKMIPVSNRDGKNGYAYFKIGNYFNKKNASDSAYYYYSKSKELYLKTNDSISCGKVLLNLAIIESNYGNYILSDSIAVKAIRFINGNRNRTTGAAYNCLAINAKRRGLYKDAILNYSKAIEIINRTKSKILYRNNLAIVYKENKDYKKAIDILGQLLKDTITSLRTRVRIIDNLSHIRWLANPKKRVLDDLLYVKSIRENENYNYDLIASYSHLSDYFKNINRNESLFYAKKMYLVAKSEKSSQDVLEAIDKIIDMETAEKSIPYYKESIYLRDSLQKEEQKRQYKFASIKYNYEEEEKQKQKFKTLATENELIAAQEKSEKKNFVILAILLFSGFVIYFFRRRQQQRKKLLEERYTTETRIAKHLHDDVANSIYNTQVKIQNSKLNTEEIINDLDRIYLKTRKISHQNDTVETGTQFESYFKQLLTNYNSEDCKIILKDLSVLKLNALSTEKQIVIYRIFNELLVNMKKHSNANLVVISCKKENKFLNISYADNGVGFQNNEVVFKNGLKNMETRIKGIGGTFSFDSASEKGCKVKIRFKN
jgi:signal transduction histidine kinase